MMFNFSSKLLSCLMRAAFLATFVFPVLQISYSQNPLWIYGNNLIHFSDAGITTSSLPQPGNNPLLHYTGQIPTKGQNCQFDNQGNLLFFIIDGNIYDGQGFLIAQGKEFLTQLTFSEETPNQLPHLLGDIAITNVPGFCDKFYLFTATKHSPSQTMLIVCSILDMAAQSVVFPLDPNRKGCLVSAFSNENNMNGTFNYFFDLDFGYPATPFFSGTILQLTSYVSLQSDYHSIEIIEVSENRKLLVLSGRLDGIVVFDISIGIFQKLENCDWADDDWGIGYYYGAVEAYPRGSSYQLAALSIDCDTEEQATTNTISIHDLSASGVVSNSSLIYVGSQDYETNLVTSIEYSPNGSYLWFTKNTSPEIGVIDLSTHEVIFPIGGNLSNYGYSEMESQIDENDNMVIYLSSSFGIKKITSPNEPSSATLTDVIWDNGITPCSSNGFNDNNLIYTLQVQNTNVQILQNFLSSAECCHDYTEFHFGEVPTITSANDGVWMNGNNPFGDQNSSIRITSDLIFPTGTSTTITNMIFEFDEDADVIIEKGAYVRLEGTTFTALSCGGMMWPGINLLGTTNAAYNIDQNPPINGDQGYLYMNNSTMEHALKAVEVGTNQTNAGGIIRAYNSTFRNNQYGVVLKKFHCINIAGNFLQNKSVFNNCTFITDAHLNHPNLAPVFHAWLTMVDKINFTNCSFMNTTPLGVYNWKERGTGIYAYQASFMVDGNNDPWDGNLGDLDQTTFYKLQYGIKSFGFNNPLAFYTCKQQEFQYCLYGIVNKNTDNVQIYQNNFVLPDADGFSTNASMERGIYLSNSTGFVVEQNQFMGSNDPLVQEDYPNALGIWVDNSGDFSNEIRNNDFNEMRLGTYVTRNNLETTISQTGLQLLCNTYINGQTDIFRDAQSFMRQDQGGNQPFGSMNACNLFSAPDCSGAISDFVIDPDNCHYNNYWCHDNANSIPDCGSFSTVDSCFGLNLLITIINNNNPYINSDCPNHYGAVDGGQGPSGIGGLVGQLNTIMEELQMAKDTYMAIVDGNQKQSTIDVLNEAFPHESQYYRDLLMQRYPLSDEVLREIILQASRLSSWHLTEVFLANSPLRPEVLLEIENAEILSSFFMEFLYGADTGASLRKLMELNITGLTTQRDKLIQQIAQSGLSYESIPEMETDQLIILDDYLGQISQLNAVVMLRSRASLLASKQDYAGAIAPVLSEPKLANFKKIIEMEQAVAGDWSLLDSTQINELWMIYENPTDWSNTMALGILQEIGLADFEPEPRVPIQYRSLQIGKDKRNEELPLLGVWPNPASGSAWLHYPIEADGNATIQVYDPQGRLMNSFQPNTHGLVELSLKNYESGIYIVQLIAFDKVVESIKLNVVNQ